MDKVLGLIGIATKAGKTAFGTEQVCDTIDKGKAYLVIIANDASEKTTKKFEDLCSKKEVKFVKYKEIELLSKTIGKQNKAVICIKDKNLSEEIYKIICGGEANG